MSSPHELFRDGQLGAALEAQIAAVKSGPTDADERLLLFVLLCFSGDLERAIIHLDTLVTLEDATKGGASVYHSLVAAEFERQKVYSGTGAPNLPPGDFPGLAERAEALQAASRGDAAAVAKALDAASAASGDQPGRIDDREFEGLCDYDDLLGNVFEVYAGGRYMWIPHADVVRIDISEPKSPLDLIWVPAEIERVDGEESNVHLPALYATSAAHDDDAIRLGRSTEWIEIGDELFRGVGQKMLFGATGDDTFDKGLLETRSIVFSR